MQRFNHLASAALPIAAAAQRNQLVLEHLQLMQARAHMGQVRIDRDAGRVRILVGMGVHAGFADLMVLCEGRVLFFELKAPKGRLRPEQEAFRDAVQAQGFGWALVRSLDDALGALADHGFTTRIAPAPRRLAP